MSSPWKIGERDHEEGDGKMKERKVIILSREEVAQVLYHHFLDKGLVKPNEYNKMWTTPEIGRYKFELGYEDEATANE